MNGPEAESMFAAHLFVHIPKTAGTSFRLALDEAFPGRTAYDYAPRAPETSEAVREHVYGKRDLTALRERLIADDVQVLGGHVHFARYAEIFPPERVITFVREPVSRVVSEYEHACRHNGYAGELMEFAATPRNQSLQTTMLRGVGLDRAALVGITERYGESLQLLRERVGWRIPELVRNVNPRRSALAGSYRLDPDQERQLRAWNEADIALYAEASAKFDEQIANW